MIVPAHPWQLGESELGFNHLHSLVEHSVLLPTQPSILHWKYLLSPILFGQIDLSTEGKKLHWLTLSRLIASVDSDLNALVLGRLVIRVSLSLVHYSSRHFVQARIHHQLLLIGLIFLQYVLSAPLFAAGDSFSHWIIDHGLLLVVDCHELDLTDLPVGWRYGVRVWKLLARLHQLLHTTVTMDTWS